MADTPGKTATATVEVTASTPSGTSIIRPLPFYTFEVYTQSEGDGGRPSFSLADPGDFNGLDTRIALRIPPSSVRVSSPIRSQTDIDLLGGVTVAMGGLGLRRWNISGTHGVGLSPEMLQSAPGGLTMAKGYAVSKALEDFFETWAELNEVRRKESKPLLRMLFAIRSGSLTEWQNEEWWINPDSLPEMNRSASRPMAWDWSLSFIAIRRMRDDQNPSGKGTAVESLLPPSARVVQDQLDNAATSVDKMEALCQKSRYLDLLAKAKELKAGLEQVRTRVSAAVSTYRSTVSGVADYIRSTARTAQETLLLLNRSNLFDQPRRDIFNAVREVQDAIGAARMLTESYRPFVPSAVSPHRVPVQPGDTLQSIAAREFGNSGRWTELAQLNGLVYPYLDFSGPDGTPDPALIAAGKRVLGQGDAIKLPNATGDVVPDDPSGTDMGDEGSVNILVGGMTNLRAALLRRLRTPRGYMPHHPDYGSDLPKYVGAPLDPAMLLSLRAEVDRVLRADPRVVSVQSIGISVDTDAIRVETTAMTALGPVSLSGVVGGLITG